LSLDGNDDDPTKLSEEESLHEPPGARLFHAEADPEAQRTAKDTPTE
jgi:hypothetical protein